MKEENQNEEITKLKEINSKQLSEIMSLQEKIQELLKNNINYNKELSDNSNTIFELEQKIRQLQEQNKEYSEFKDLFQNQNPEDILREFKIQSEGNHQLFSDYEEIRLELKRVKYEKENYEKLYKDLLLYSNYSKDKNDLGNKNEINNYKNKIAELKDELDENKKYQKENEIMQNMLYQIYNLLFEAFRLDKNIKINRKYKYIKKEDFNPNIFSSVEIANYVKLMIKTMKESLAEQELRETIVYANMLVRAYLPEKLNMKYKPVEILCEIKKLVDNNCEKLKKAESNYKLSLEKIRNLENEINIMKGKVKQEELKFDKYQKIVDKIIIKDKNSNKNQNNNDKNNNKENSRSSSKNKAKNKIKINVSVECGRRRIIPRERYFINASEKK